MITTANDSCTQNLLVREDSVLIVIDIQNKLMPVIHSREKPPNIRSVTNAVYDSSLYHGLADQVRQNRAGT